MADETLIRNSAALATIFRNTWDRVFLCDCCRDELTAVGIRRLAETETPAEPAKTTSRSVYFIGADDGPIKIGSSANPEARMRELQTGHPHRLSILAQVPGGFDQEGRYHNQFNEHRLEGEWFERTPELLAEITRLCEVKA